MQPNHRSVSDPVDVTTMLPIGCSATWHRDDVAGNHEKQEQDKKGLMMAARTFSELFEIAFVLVRCDHVACMIVNANHTVM